MSEYIYGTSLRAAKSKANYLFDGDFRRRPNQDLSGASRSVARGELLQQAAQQRQNREDVRRKEDAALKIQSLFRGYRSRSTLAATLTSEFDASILLAQQQPEKFGPQQIALLNRALIVFYHRNRDEDRLLLMINLMVQRINMVLELKRIDPGLWGIRISRLLTMCLGAIRKHTSSDIDKLSCYLEFFQIFTRPGDVLTEFESIHLWTKLIRSSFFTTMRTLYDNNLHVELSVELIRRSLDTDPRQISPCDIKPPYCFFEQYLRQPLEASLEELVFTKLLKSKPRQLEPNIILQAFRESHKVRNGFSPSHWTTQFGLNRPHSEDLHEIKQAIQLCYLLIKSLNNRTDVFNDSEKVEYINFIATSIEPAEYMTSISLMKVENNLNHSEKDDDEPMSTLYSSSGNHQLTHYHTDTHHVITKIIGLINELPHIDSLKSIIFSGSSQNQVQDAIVKICNLMLSHEPLAIFNCRLLYTVAFSKQFSRTLWRSIVTATSPSIYMSSTPIHVQIARGSQSISRSSWKTILPKLTLFCSLCSYLLPTLNDEEFYTENQIYSLAQDEQPNSSASSECRNDSRAPGSEANSSISTFYIDKELVTISAILRDLAVGLVEIIYQRNVQMMNQIIRSPMEADHMDRVVAISSLGSKTVDEDTRLLSFEIKSSFQALVRILCQLHARDSWKRFCPEGHWMCSNINIPSNKSIDFHLVTIQQGRLLDQIGCSGMNTERQLNVSREIKTVLILQEIPFVIPFHDRVQVFHQLLKRERKANRSERFHFGFSEGTISVKVRRNYIYEDAFEKLSSDKEPNMKQPLRVSMINEIGLDEVGVDGGGLTKEFLSELLKAGFDPMRGFFKCTNDNFLYPNPSANVLFANLSEGFEVHYEFLGRMLGKAIFEKIMVELPFASFFLAKLLAVKHSSDVDLHNLESLDPVLYKNLVYLKNYRGDVADLDLDFTISNNDLDEHEVIELKPGGSKIAVTRENKIEYVHLVADYRLNKQIRLQCAAFKRGLAQLIDLDWLRMFDSRELQILISGAPTIIDVNDWREHTHYCNGYSNDSPAIKAFWAAVRQMDESSKRKLLKFATSVSLPPLLGFKDLVPSFAIAPSDEQRLPTASTCMNLLKLPQIEDEETMRSKLLYAIESNSGFELS